MRLIFWSFAVFACAILLLMPDLEPSWVVPAEYAKYPIYSLLALSFLLQLEATGALKLRARVRALEDEKEKMAGKEKESTSFQEKLEEAKASLEQETLLKNKSLLEMKSLKDLVTNYKNAQKDSGLKISDLEKQLEKQKGGEQALTLLSLLQAKGRLLDFLMDDITAYENEQVGSAARVVHTGCQRVLKEYFDISPLLSEDEGATIRLQKDPSPLHYKIIGDLSSTATEPQGTLLHRGWKTNRINLPQSFRTDGSDHIIFPAEVEVN